MIDTNASLSADAQKNKCMLVYSLFPSDSRSPEYIYIEPQIWQKTQEKQLVHLRHI